MKGGGDLGAGRFYDGVSAAAQTVMVHASDRGIHFRTEDGARQDWPYRKIAAEPLGEESRLTCQGVPDAQLLMPRRAAEALMRSEPYLSAESRRRRQTAAMLTGFTAAVGAILLAIFWGIPAAAPTLVRLTPPEAEERLGSNLASQFELVFGACRSQKAEDLLAPFTDEMAEALGIERPVRLRIVKAADQNAFALPGGQMMATQGLLDVLKDDQEAFWAVVAHELVHVKNRDSLGAAYRNLGASTLIEIVTGGTGLAQQILLLGGQVTNLAYTREQERLADEGAYSLLGSLGFNPAALGRALIAIDDEGPEEADGSFSDRIKLPAWLRSHPDTEERMRASEGVKMRGARNLPLTDKAWAAAVTSCSDTGVDRDGGSGSDKGADAEGDGAD